jgi:hypothetical protein
VLLHFGEGCRFGALRSHAGCSFRPSRWVHAKAMSSPCLLLSGSSWMGVYGQAWPSLVSTICCVWHGLHTVNRCYWAIVTAGLCCKLSTEASRHHNPTEMRVCTDKPGALPKDCWGTLPAEALLPAAPAAVLCTCIEYCCCAAVSEGAGGLQCCHTPVVWGHVATAIPKEPSCILNCLRFSYHAARFVKAGFATPCINPGACTGRMERCGTHIRW